MSLRSIGKWEYKCLIRDMRFQDDDWEYEGGFNKWYEEVFLIDDAWEEIRNNYNEGAK